MRHGDPVRVELGDLVFEWIDGWAKLPRPQAHHDAWPHQGIAATAGDEIVVFDPAEPRLLVLYRDGNVLRVSQPLEIAEAHGITAVREDGVDRVWLTYTQQQRTAATRYQAGVESAESAVLKVDLDGRVVLRPDRPPHPAYRDGHYRPTMVAVDERRLGGSDDVWVADGYGESLVHQFDALGRYRRTLTGEEGAGRFKGPHALFIDRRRTEPELYVADRGNGRVQVYGLDGRFHRSFGDEHLSAPTGFASDGEHLFLVEFRPPRLTMFDRDDTFAGYACEDADAPKRPGFPYPIDGAGNVVRTPVRIGTLQTPHALTIDRAGDLYITEAVIGARFTKLRRVRPGAAD